MKRNKIKNIVSFALNRDEVENERKYICKVVINFETKQIIENVS